MDLWLSLPWDVSSLQQRRWLLLAAESGDEEPDGEPSEAVLLHYNTLGGEAEEARVVVEGEGGVADCRLSTQPDGAGQGIEVDRTSWDELVSSHQE